MSLSSLALETGTTISATGGSAITFAPDGAPVGDKVTLYCLEDTDLRTRRSVEITVRRPRASASTPNGYTQARVFTTYKHPFLLDNGEITTFTQKTETSYDAEALFTEVDGLTEIGSQLLFSTVMRDVFTQLSLA